MIGHVNGSLGMNERLCQLQNCCHLLAYNHPSGDPASSFDTTKQLIEAGKMMGIPVNDHIIVGRSSYTSFRQQELLVF